MAHDRARPRRTRLMARLLVAAATLSGAAHATDGTLDPEFGVGGIALAGLSGVSSDGPPHPLVQPDGKILYCSPLSSGGTSGDDFVVLRFNADGTPDTSFSFDGQVTVDFGGGNDACNALALQPDGKIVAVGSTVNSGVDYDFAVARLDADGTLDATFGGGTGKSVIAFDLADLDDDRAHAVALQPDGRIVVAGYALAGANGDYDFAVVRLSPDGTRDTTFNGNGRVTIPFDLPQATHRMDVAAAVVVDDEGRIVLGGSAEANGNASDFAVARLLPDGTLDDEFDADGRRTIAFDLGASTDDIAYQAILQRDGRIVLAGGADAGSGATNVDMALVRLLPDGSSDPSFGVGGKVVVPFDVGGLGYDYAFGLVEDTASRLVVAGASSISASNYGASVLRLRADGTVDASFGTFGKVIVSASGVTMAAYGVALQGTQIIIAGQHVAGTFDDFVARLDVDLLFADGFE